MTIEITWKVPADVVSPPKKRGFWRLLADLLLTVCTGGLWLVWVLIRRLGHRG